MSVLENLIKINLVSLADTGSLNNITDFPKSIKYKFTKPWIFAFVYFVGEYEVNKKRSFYVNMVYPINNAHNANIIGENQYARIDCDNNELRISYTSPNIRASYITIIETI